MDFENTRIYGEWLLNSKNSSDFKRTDAIEKFEVQLFKVGKTPQEFAWKIFAEQRSDFSLKLHQLIYVDDKVAMTWALAVYEERVRLQSEAQLAKLKLEDEERARWRQVREIAEKEEREARLAKQVQRESNEALDQLRLKLYDELVTAQTHYLGGFVFRLAAWTKVPPFGDRAHDTQSARRVFIDLLADDVSGDRTFVIIREVLAKWEEELEARIAAEGIKGAVALMLEAVDLQGVTVEVIEGFHAHFSRTSKSIGSEPNWADILMLAKSDWPGFGRFLESIETQYYPVMKRERAGRKSPTNPSVRSYVESLDARYYSVFGAER
jgi:hypothetical protein